MNTDKDTSFGASVRHLSSPMSLIYLESSSCSSPWGPIMPVHTKSLGLDFGLPAGARAPNAARTMQASSASPHCASGSAARAAPLLAAHPLDARASGCIWPSTTVPGARPGLIRTWLPPSAWVASICVDAPCAYADLFLKSRERAYPVGAHLREPNAAGAAKDRSPARSWTTYVPDPPYLGGAESDPCEAACSHAAPSTHVVATPSLVLC